MVPNGSKYKVKKKNMLLFYLSFVFFHIFRVGHNPPPPLCPRLTQKEMRLWQCFLVCVSPIRTVSLSSNVPIEGLMALAMKLTCYLRQINKQLGTGQSSHVGRIKFISTNWTSCRLFILDNLNQNCPPPPFCEAN